MVYAEFLAKLGALRVNGRIDNEDYEELKKLGQALLQSGRDLGIEWAQVNSLEHISFSRKPYIERLKEEFPDCTIRIKDTADYVGYLIIDKDGIEWGIDQRVRHWGHFLKKIEYLKDLMKTEERVEKE